ncbi:helix-turn-helix domain-containing protein [Weissella sp. LMG 11983]|uniref:helix-turn-helix domain-containing protein n=1 Tax=Weissella sp. LMG 11983 TaxID=2987700 RepID=UPI0021F81788|nr:helix-turn-helix domain-containing protein [Weissella sp. LMG 11983]MCW0927874.1 helix-turn-helix domain-containing protein [Weissella sp. LMG 11983]
MSDGDKKKRTFKRLSFEERILIQEYWNGQSLTVSEVARRLNRDYTTIWNELRRGVSYDISDVNPKELKFNAHAWIRYSAEVAEYNSKKKNESRSGPLKLTRKMVEVVEHDMNVKFWSPEDVVARHPEIKVSASTIRNYIRKGYIRVDGPYGQKRKRPNHISTSEELKLLKAERERLEKERLAKMNSSEFLQTVSLTRYSIDERPKSVEIGVILVIGKLI